MGKHATTGRGFDGCPSPCLAVRRLLGVLLAGCWQATTVHFSTTEGPTGTGPVLHRGKGLCKSPAGTRCPPLNIFKGGRPAFDWPSYYPLFVAPHDPVAFAKGGWVGNKPRDGPEAANTGAAFLVSPGWPGLLAAGPVSRYNRLPPTIFGHPCFFRILRDLTG